MVDADHAASDLYIKQLLHERDSTIEELRHSKLEAIREQMRLRLENSELKVRLGELISERVHSTRRIVELDERVTALERKATKLLEQYNDQAKG